MKSLKKRIFASVLAGAMALTMATSAFAADEPNSETTITGKYQKITIDVTVPATGDVVINPYGLPVVIEKSDGTEVKITGQQITTKPLTILNNTDIALTVGVSATATAKGNLKFVNASNAESTTAGNNAFVYLQALATNAAKDKTTKDDDADALSDALTDAFVAWAASDYDADADVLIGSTAVAKADFATLAASTVTAATSVGGTDVPAFTTYKEGSALMFRLAGDLSPVVKTPWKADAAAQGDTPAVVGDGFEVKLAFTFVPTAE